MVKVEVECPSVEAPFGRDGAEPKEILIEDVGWKKALGLGKAQGWQGRGSVRYRYIWMSNKEWVRTLKVVAIWGGPPEIGESDLPTELRSTAWASQITSSRRK